MDLHHSKPCPSCPWRRTSTQGYLGGHDPLWYADALAHGEIPACHLTDRGPDDTRTAFCAGAAATMANACMVPFKQRGARAAVQMVGRRADCFSHQSEFYAYHAGKPYTHPLLRPAGLQEPSR